MNTTGLLTVIGIGVGLEILAFVLLGLVGLGPINVLGDPTWATYGIIAAGLWPQTAYCMILYLTGLNAVDPEQIEAGRLDNARGWRMLWYIIIPQLKTPQKSANCDVSSTAWAKIIRGETDSMAAAGVGMPLKNPGMGFLSRVK